MRPSTAKLLRSALLAVALTLTASDGGAQEPTRERLSSIEIVEAGRGQVVELRGDGTFDRVGVQLFRDLGVILQLPAMTPEPTVRDQRPATGLVSAIEISTEERDGESTTVVVVRTREPVTQSVNAEAGLLRIRLAPMGTPIAMDDPRPGSSSDTVEVTTLQAALEQSNRARAQQAARLENMAAEAESLEIRAEALELNRRTLESDLETERARVATLERQTRQQTEELTLKAEQAHLREVDLQAQIANLEAGRELTQEEVRKLKIRVEAATLERQEANEKLAAAQAALAASREELSGAEARAAQQTAELAAVRAERDRVASELSQARAESGKQYQREKARTDAARLESTVATLEQTVKALEADLAATRAEAEQAQTSLLSKGETLTNRIEEVEAEKDRLENALAEANAARALLDETLESTRRERDLIDAQLAARKAEIDRTEQSGFDRKLELAREVEYRVAELRRELDETRYQLELARETNSELLGRLMADESRAEPQSEVRPLEPADPAPADEPVVEPLSDPELVEVQELAAVAPSEPPAAAATPAWASRATRLRAGPSTQDEILANVPEANPLSVLATEGNWCRVRLEREGWVATDFVALEATADGRAIAADRINLRSEPSLDGEFLDTLPTETSLRVLATFDNWYQVRAVQEGWIYAPLVSLEPPAVPEDVPTEQG